MKQPVNFRLSQHALSILALLEKKLHTSKTAVIEKSLLFYVEQKLKSHHALMKFAGVLSEKTSDDMLNIIKENKHNKRLKVAL